MTDDRSLASSGWPSAATWPVRRVLFLSTSLLVLAIAGTGIVLSVIQRRHVVQDLSRLVIERSQEEAAAELHSLFDPIQRRLQVDWRATRTGLIRRYQTGDIASLLLPSLYHLPMVASMMVADTTGYQLLLMRYDSAVIRSPLLSHRSDLPTPSIHPRQYFTRDFRPATWGDESAWSLWDPTGAFVTSRWQERLPDYDPKQRDWFLQAMQRFNALQASGDTLDPQAAIAWTDVYTLFTTKNPGISASFATREPSGDIVIVAYDLLLQDLSQFTSAKRPTPRGRVFVITDDGRLVGMPAGQPFDNPAAWEANFLADVGAVGDPTLAAWSTAWRARTSDSAVAGTFRSGGELWWSGHRPFTVGGDHILWVGITIPEADLLAGARSGTLTIVAVAAVALVAALILAGFFARSISAPLAAVVEQSDRIQALDLSPRPRVATRLSEVHRLGTSIDAMRQALAERMASREEAMRELGDSEARFRATFEQAAVGIAHMGADGRYLRVNNRYAEIVGRPLGDLLGWLHRDLTHPDDVAAEEARFGAIAARSGSPQDEPANHWENRVLRPDGDIVWTQKTVSCLRTDDGAVRYFIIVVQDISERKSLEEQLRQSQKLEAVGQLAGGIAHDFNNLLTAVLGYASLIRTNLSPSDPIAGDLSQIETSAHRAGELTRQLLAFARRQRVEPRVVQVNDLVARTERLLQRLLGAQVDLVTRLAGQLPAVRVDPGQLEQVLVNLAVNARDAMPDGGILTIETAQHSSGHPLRPAPAGLPAGDYVVLFVRDNGTGMSAAVQARVFEPFFTTKDPGKGTGLGLATCWGIVQQAGGLIDLSSVPGEGSVFRVFLPAVFQEAGPLNDPPPPAAIVPKQNATILLVEDERQIRVLAARTLETRGYRVLVATDGEDALEVSRNHDGQIDLMVSDVVMPRLGGTGLAARIRQERPGIAILLMSGYTTDGPFAVGGAAAYSFIQKPFTLEAFLQRVASLLNNADNGGRPGPTS